MSGLLAFWLTRDSTFANDLQGGLTTPNTLGCLTQ